MNKRQWMQAGLEIERHLRKIRNIARRRGLRQISAAVFSDGISWATYIEDSTGDIYEVNIDEDGVATLRLNQEEYYTKS